MDVLAVIPARGGSKRVSRKNIREVGGKPLIGHTIQAAQQSTNISQFFVSTEDDEIAEIARDFGSTIVNRPPELAQDTSPVSDSITHVLNNYDGNPDFLCLLQPTVPLRTSADIDAAVQKFAESEANSLISITKPFHPPDYALIEDNNEYLVEAYDPEVLWGGTHRTQDLPERWVPNGAIYITSVNKWRENESFYIKPTSGFKMPTLRSINIDEVWELDIARALCSYDGKYATSYKDRISKL